MNAITIKRLTKKFNNHHSVLDTESHHIENNNYENLK